MHIKVGYRSWTARPLCTQNQRPSSSLNIIPAAWKVCLLFHSPHFLDSALKFVLIFNMHVSLNVYRNGQDIRRRECRALRGVNKSLVWKPSWGKVQLSAEAELLWRQAVVVHCLFWLFKLTPIISDPEYLLDQHVLICVKSTDSDESYGNELADNL